MQPALCPENPTLLNSPDSAVKPKAPHAPKPLGKMANSVVGRNGRIYKLKPDANKRHDLYGIWSGMKNRCYNRRGQDFKHYGGRGIKVCARWKNNFKRFVLDMGMRPTSKHELDRINNSGNYEPGNCKWATRFEQMQHTRRTRIVTISGESKTISQWGRESKSSVRLVHQRISDGWNPKIAVSKEPQKLGSWLRKMTTQNVIEIRMSKDSHSSLARKFGVCVQSICNVRNGNTYKEAM